LDRFELEVFCQRCSQYLTTLTGVNRPGTAAASAQLRQEAQAHAKEVGCAIEAMYYVTLKRTAVIEPRPAA
jgi:phage terminase small subunit